ncbi:uncharacterized protein I303_107769 [Kwoniella dejecticola CBS 10117]|uniref:Uncharacterized protein n=1 Tax=Kwoniella dejecticola CBS 10117 TaxID=1296121 RepID=A0A1A5ZVN0_9TREE|nr:uncharacterized protein I303_07774 [Kwoniella dejecticola CBS 10117]OBR81864.1 hypothetical protein I303_07774 [Kwoniella dejecticola CBS 10117]
MSSWLEYLEDGDLSWTGTSPSPDQNEAFTSPMTDTRATLAADEGPRSSKFSSDEGLRTCEETVHTTDSVSQGPSSQSYTLTPINHGGRRKRLTVKPPSSLGRGRSSISRTWKRKYLNRQKRYLHIKNVIEIYKAKSLP